MKFCGQIAMNTAATVIAATDTQFYSTDTTFWQWITGQQGEIDFGNWEGTVYTFSPVDGSSAPLCVPAPAPVN
jgi:hypothetical protein